MSYGAWDSRIGTEPINFLLFGNVSCMEPHWSKTLSPQVMGAFLIETWQSLFFIRLSERIQRGAMHQPFAKGLRRLALRFSIQT